MPRSSTEHGAAVGIQDAVVEIVDGDGARQGGQLEGVAGAVELRLGAPIAAIGAAIHGDATRILRDEDVRLKRGEGLEVAALVGP